jgi:uncharacterized protein YndB with AHSA1/START domain
MPTADAIVHEVVYAHPAPAVWQALTDADALGEWLMPNDFEPRVGHRFTFKTDPQPDWSGVVECEVVELDEPRRLAYTWRGGPGLPTTLVTFTLEPVAGGTRLRLEHTGFAAGGPPAASVRDLLDSGWGANLLRGTLPALLDRWAAGQPPPLAQPTTQEEPS